VGWFKKRRRKIKKEINEKSQKKKKEKSKFLENYKNFPFLFLFLSFLPPLFITS